MQLDEPRTEDFKIDVAQVETGEPAPPAETHDLGARVRRASLWTVASAASPRLLSFATMAVVARILSPSDFGVFAVAVTVHLVVFSVATLGVSIVLTRGDIDVDEVAPTVAAISLISATVMSAAMFAFAAPIATALGAPGAAAPLRVLSISLFLAGCFPVPVALLTREFRTKELFIAQLAGMIPANVVLIVLALNGGGAMSFAWSRVLEHGITGVCTIFYARRFDWPRIKLDVAQRVLRFGLPVALSGALTMVLLNADYAVVGRQLGSYQLGFYMMAFNVASWPTALMGATIISLAVPAFSRLADDHERRRRAVNTASRTVGVISFPICALTMALARPLLVTVYGAKWAPSTPVLQTLAVYGSMAVLCTLFSYLIVSQGRTAVLVPLQLAWLGALIPAMIIGVHLRGIVGAGDAHVIVMVCVVLPLYLLVFARSGIVRIREPLYALLYPLFAAVLSGLAAAAAAMPFSSEPVQLIVGMIAGVVAYAVVMSPLLSRALADHTSPGSFVGRIANYYLILGRSCSNFASALRVGPRRDNGPTPRVEES